VSRQEVAQATALLRSGGKEALRDQGGQSQLQEEGRTMMTGTLKRSVTGVLVACAIVAGLAASNASAASPWWHLTTNLRSNSIQPGHAKDEVVQLTVEGSSGVYLLEDEEETTFGEGYTALIRVGETSQEVQESLEEIYSPVFGPNCVEVTGGPGEEKGAPYEIKFVNGLADRPVNLTVPIYRVTRENEESGKVVAKELVKGASDGVITVTATNVGDANATPQEGASVTLNDVLPAGLKPVTIEGSVDEGFQAFSTASDPLFCSLGSVSCTFTGTEAPGSPPNQQSSNNSHRYPFFVPPYYQLQMRIRVNSVGARTGEVNAAHITGGHAPSASFRRPIVVGDAPSFGVDTYEIRPEEEGGALDTQAGSHPFQLTTTLMANEDELGDPVALTKDLHFKLPPGLIGNPTPFQRCTLAQFLHKPSNECAAQTVVGVARAYLNLSIATRTPSFGRGGSRDVVFPLVQSLFNIEPSVGEPARFGFIAFGIPVLLDTSVRTGGDYGVTVDVKNISEAAEFLGSEVTFWGVPGDARHNISRGENCLTRQIATAESEFGELYAPPCQQVEELHPAPLLSLPTSCTGPLTSTVEGDSWKEPSVLASSQLTSPVPALDGCNRLQFNPAIEVTPDSQAGSTPTGLAVKVNVPQAVSLNPYGLSEADVKNTTVALPAGIAVNPSGADGLQACSEEQIALKSAEPPTCPNASKLGLVKIKTPLLPNPLEGAAYLASQNSNPFGSLLAMYVFVEDPVSGARVKLAGEVTPNPLTGQLVATFKNTPQLPFETFELHFFGGDRAPLASPTYCGAYTTTASVEPWTETGEADSSSTFDIASGPASFSEPNGGPCPGDVLPFNPSLSGGATNISAGVFSPLTLTMTRKDGEQNLQSVEAHLPPGLAGILSNIELCREPQANLGECGPNSLIGETTISVGVGGDPFTVGGGKFYLTGPYNGTGSCTVGSAGCAPFGITFEVPAKAGPFDLKRNAANPAGEDPCDCVIVRGKIEVNPITAAITVTSDPPGSPYAIPTSIEGIPLEIQHINATTTRGDFQFNPTNCEKMAVTGTLHSSENTTRTIGVPFQVTNCAALKFAPKFSVSTSGQTSKANGASLNVKLTYPKEPFGSQANMKSVKVDLPKQLPSRLTTLQKACLAAQFEANPAGCPADSIVGHATAITPLVPVPLTGPAYFVSYGGAKFPELVVALQGYNLTLDLHGETFISKAGITSSTFKTIPDAPVGSFELTLPEGKYSALAANGDLCQAKLAMPTAFTAQNGVTIKQSTPIVTTGCKPAISVVSHSVTGKTATIAVSVPSAGRLTAAGADLSKASAKSNKARTIVLKLKLLKVGESLLEKHAGRKLEAKVHLTFTTIKGAKLKAAVTVLIV
jgi:hypothetical protein